MADFAVELLTPLRRFHVGRAESALFETDDGRVEILAGHAPTAMPVRPSTLRLLAEGTARRAAIGEGIALVRPDKVEFYVDTAEWPGEIDRERAVRALERASARLATETFEWEKARSRAAVARAKSRIATVDLEASAAAAGRGAGAAARAD